MRRVMVLAAVAGLLSFGLLAAQDQAGQGAGASQDDQGQAQQSPPVSSSVVARLSIISGSVSTQRGDTGQWAAGTLNAPLVTGDKVAAAARSRAEVQLDYADTLRLGDSSQVNLVNLSQNQIQIQLASGLADYVVLKGAQASSEIDTPNISIRPRGPGVFRVLVSSDSETQVIVRKGEADISTPQGSTDLQEGQLITVQGTDTPEYKISDAPAEDAWDQWNNERDQVAQNSPSLRYTNPYYTGVQDLDNYGYWTYVPGYGEVWVPNNQGSDWSPYSDGSWTWEPYWGWTWVGYEPWGWAPYHYGRWFWWGSSWAWWPGPVTPFYRPFWAPAYVSFFGWGGGFGFGVGFGSIGWLPIGPCDPFRPWWGVGFGFNRFSVFNARGGRFVSPLMPIGRGHATFSNLDALRSNARVRNGLIRVSSADFARGGLQGRERVSAAELNRGSLVGGHLPVVPQRQSLTMGRATSSRPMLAHSATNFFGSRSTVAARSNFAQEQSRMQTGMRSANTSPAQFARSQAAGARGGAETAARPSSGMQRFNANAGASAPFDRNAHTAAPSAAAPARSGWSRFGASSGAEARAGSGSRSMPESRGMTARSADPGWQHFTPQPRSEASSGYRGAGSQGGYARPQFNGSESRGGNSRPPLEMGHPIVQAPRGNSGGGYFNHPGYFDRAPAPSRSSGGSYGGYSAPRSSGSYGGGGRPSGGSYSAPRSSGGYGGGRPSGGGGGGGGGGMSHGGGGGGASHGGGGGGHGHGR